MMMGIVAQQPEPHTWRGAEAVAGSGGLSSSGAFSPFGLMSARFAGAGAQVARLNYRNMRATFAGAGALLATATSAQIFEGSVAFAGIGNFSQTADIYSNQISAAFFGSGALAASATTSLIGSAAFIGSGQLAVNTEQAETTAWVNAVISAGGTVSDARKVLVDNLISGLKADGLWNKLDRLWLFAAENTQSALIDLRNVSTATVVSGPSFTANQGYTGNGGGYIETNLNASTGGPWKYLRDDAHWSWWNLTNSLTALSNQILHGSNQSSVGMQVFSNAIFPRVNSGSGSQTPPSSIGQFIGSRNNSSTHNNYFNGLNFAVTSAASVAVPNNTFRVMWADSGNKSTTKCAAYSVGGNLDSGSDAAKFYERLRVYMSAVGIATQIQASASLSGSGTMIADGTIV